MITGLIAIAIAFVTAVISMTAYILYYQDKQENRCSCCFTLF
jgi:hypothetical protein